MATAQSTKLLSARTVEAMKPGDKDKQIPVKMWVCE